MADFIVNTPSKPATNGAKKASLHDESEIIEIDCDDQNRPEKQASSKSGDTTLPERRQSHTVTSVIADATNHQTNFHELQQQQQQQAAAILSKQNVTLLQTSAPKLVHHQNNTFTVNNENLNTFSTANHQHQANGGEIFSVNSLMNGVILTMDGKTILTSNSTHANAATPILVGGRMPNMMAPAPVQQAPIFIDFMNGSPLNINSQPTNAATNANISSTTALLNMLGSNQLTTNKGHTYSAILPRPSQQQQKTVVAPPATVQTVPPKMRGSKNMRLMLSRQQEADAEKNSGTNQPWVRTNRLRLNLA